MTGPSKQRLDPTGPAGDESKDERERQRRYALGAMAQSYAPRGLADLLNLSPEGRARARKNWQAVDRRSRVTMFISVTVIVAGLGLMVWGFASSNDLLILIPALLLSAVTIGNTIVAILGEVRRRG